MPEKITFDSFRAALVKGIEERGENWQYPQNRDDPQWYVAGYDGDLMCRYAHDDGTPACIIGYALNELGYEISPTNTSGAYDVVRRATRKTISETTDADTDVFNRASNLQMAQDTGVPWGEALAYFDDPNKRVFDEEGV